VKQGGRQSDSGNLQVGRGRQVAGRQARKLQGMQACRGSGRHFRGRQERPTGRLGQRQAEAGMHTEAWRQR
jgi:hypothetical protein